MINDKNILIKNIYYMLVYNFKPFNFKENPNISNEEFDNIENLFAYLLSKLTSKQIKQGLFKRYEETNENITTLKGRINITKTIKNKIQNQKKLNCEYDELTENNIYNQIIKSTINILIKQDNVLKQNKVLLKKNLVHFSNVEITDVNSINWKKLNINKYNKNYQIIINICKLVLEGLLISTEKGNYKLSKFIKDSTLELLYQGFIFNYFKFNYNLKVNADKYDWKNASGETGFLPKMNTDITLHDKNNVLIIDAKYYGETMAIRYNKRTYHSSNMYQIYTYVKNYNLEANVSGMLLYAKTNEEITPNQKFELDGNKMEVKTLDLNKNFKEIEKQLDNIVKDYFKLEV